jgi:UDP-N-acetylglucosamine 1-carboxyvinyltransferase
VAYIRVNGGAGLFGSVDIQGSKNGVLPVLAATVLIKGTSVIKNCPDLADVRYTVDILRYLGCIVNFSNNVLTVDASALSKNIVPCELMDAMRSSVLFLGALLARTGRAELCRPGGCELGPRPIDLHISSFAAMGAEIEQSDDHIYARMRRRAPAEILLPIPSVGATENIMLLASSIPGTTRIVNAAREPEIVDLQNFMLSAGISVRGAGSPVVEIDGSSKTPNTSPEITVSGDRIAAATYLCAAAISGGRVTLRGCNPEHVKSVSELLTASGCLIRETKTELALCAPPRLSALGYIRTGVYPAFPTDAGPIMISCMAAADGETMFEETIFQNRYRHVPELIKMGAEIKVNGRYARCTGVPGFYGAKVHASDLRGGAALVLAALAAEGTSEIQNSEHIDRGYEKFDSVLQSLGADVVRLA